MMHDLDSSKNHNENNAINKTSFDLVISHHKTKELKQAQEVETIRSPTIQKIPREMLSVH